MENGCGLSTLLSCSGEWSLQSEQGTQSAGQRRSLPSWCLSDEQSSFCLVFVCFCCCSCYCSVFFLFSWVLLCSSLLSNTISLYHPHTPPRKLPFFCPFLCLDFPISVSIQFVLVSLVVAASELTECLCHAVCLKPWFYCCHTKLNLTWLLGCYLQFISLSAALVKRTLSRYFFFIIFQIIFFTVYNNPLKAWNLDLSLPKILSIIHSHWFVVVELRLYVGLCHLSFCHWKRM